MNEKELIEKLRLLNNIVPRPEYINQSKMAILSSPRTMQRRWEMVGRGVFVESFNFGFSMILATVALVLILGGATTVLKPVFLSNLPGVDTNNLLTEADAVSRDIDIQLTEAKYYAVAAKETSVALNEVSVNGPAAHTNPILIQNEIETLDFQNPKNSNIDDLLNKLSQ